MKATISNFAFLMLCMLPTASVAGPGVIVGNGGDPLGRTILQGQSLAVIQIRQLQVSYVADLPIDVREWIRENRQRLARDLSRTSLEFVQEKPSWCPVQTCACTLAEPQAVITFLYDRCQISISDEWVAAELLVHEAVHHLGITDENLAYRMGRAVMMADADLSIHYDVDTRTCIDELGRPSLIPGALGECAMLNHADMSEVKDDRGESLRGGHFLWADFSRTQQFSGRNFDDAVLDDANLKRARFDATSFVRASLARVDGRDGIFRAAIFHDATLDGANLEGASIERAQFFGASLRGVNLSATKARFSRFHYADLRQADLHRGDFRGAEFFGADLQGADLRDARMCDADLSYANLEGANLRGLLISEATRLPISNVEAFLRGALLRPPYACVSDVGP